ncbi:MAG: hypothetical protein DYG96_13735 [Chlorobi bacterium CHB2]|nr:hypothetical protein [Chlorobi bacterium CHB2]
MTIQEQIIALLSGDLTNQTEAAELLHVLSVSPEKRGMLIEQIRLARGFSSVRGSVAPPPGADAAILQGLAGIDAAVGAAAGASAAAAVSASTAASATSTSIASPLAWSVRPAVRALVAGVLLVAGVGIGYLLFNRTEIINNGTAAQAAQPREVWAAGEVDSVALLRGHVGELQQQLASTAQQYESARVQIEGLRNRPAQLRTVVLRDTVWVSSATPESVTAQAVVASGDTSAAVQSLPLHGPPHPAIVLDSLLLINAPTIAMRSATVAPAASLPSNYRWQVGLRNHFRMSLPKLSGLPNLQNTLTDREGFISYAMQSQEELPQLSAGAAVGETQFGLMYHTNTGGARTDTVFLTTPILNYGRLWIAPTLFTIGESLNASLELGGGGTQIGPFGTAGVAMEYRAGERATLHAGVSSWFLWTKFRDQLYTSTNLNGSIGIAFRW